MCAFLMYAMWWYKPFTPKEPIVLKGSWVKSFCAFALISSEISGDFDPESFKSQTMVRKLLAFLRLYSKAPEIESLSTQKIIDPRPGEQSATSSESCRVDEPQGPTNDLPKTTIKLTPASKQCLAELWSKKLDKATGTAIFERRPRVKGTQKNPILASSISTRRWSLASSAINTYPAILEHSHFHSHQ